MTRAREQLSFPLYLLIFIALMRISLSRCDSVLTVTEDEDVTLEFPYPCDSYKVTVQNANRLPFYSSVNQDVQDLDLPISDALRFSVSNENCSVRVFISPVKRSDEATYICQAYRPGVTHSELIRIRLNVKYPPGSMGRVRCTFKMSTDTVGKWVPLYCAASIGTLEGEIKCYQGSKRLPPQSRLVKAGEMLEQTIWVSRESTVFCCSSILSEPKDMCDCRDFSWNPVQSDTISDPCSASTSVQSATTKHEDKMTITENQLFTTNRNMTPSIINARISNEKLIPLLHGIVLFILISTFIIIALLYVCLGKKAKKKKTLT
nr:uncharacterized protein LOC129258675 [Lytechinus pictus]